MERRTAGSKKSKSKQRKQDRLRKSIKIATWNVQAKASHAGDIEIIAGDMRSRRISICCLQETQNANEYSMELENRDYIIFLGRQEDNNGGLAFYVSQEWKEYIYSVRKITDRIAAITFKYRVNTRNKYLTIMNVYGYTQMRASREPQLVGDFYQKLGEAYEYERRSTDIVVISGDFNAKLGSRESGEELVVGKYGIGVRNSNGDELAEFLLQKGLYTINMHFKHRRMQIATWHGGRPATKSCKPAERRNQPGLHNQIDYMLIPRRSIRLVSNCKAIMPGLFQHRSDHSVVEMSVEVGALYKMSARKRSDREKRNMQVLQDPEVKEQYQAAVARRLERIPSILEEGKVVEAYRAVKEAVKEAAAVVLPPADRRICGRVRYMSDNILAELRSRQRKLTVKIYGKSTRTAEQIKNLKGKRKEIFKEMRKRMSTLYTMKMNQLAEEVCQGGETRAVYEYARYMQKSATKVGFKLIVPLRGQVSQHMEVRDTDVKIREVTKYFSEFFKSTAGDTQGQWSGDPRPLVRPVAVAEIAQAAACLRNKRALGPDEMEGELLKYGGPELYRVIAEVVNGIFEKHESIEELKHGYIVPLNKPPKPCSINNIRPLVLLTVMRKVVSRVVLNRISADVEKYLSPGQHAYRQGRSTSEAVLAVQWICATTERYAERVRVMGVDLSKAFDCLNRPKLMMILRDSGIGSEDEARMIGYLLSETKLMVKIEGKVGPMFPTETGTPQGDSLSPILFLIYLEHILRSYPRQDLIRSSRAVEISYADDVVIAMREEARDADKARHEYREECMCMRCEMETLERTLPAQFARYDMQMNEGKTVRGEVRPRENTLPAVLGCEVSGEREVAARRRKAAAAFNALCRVWKQSKLPRAMKLKLYKGMVEPHFTYCGGAMALKKAEMDKLDALHRKQLRYVLGVFYPAHMSNVEVYTQASTVPVSVKCVAARVSLMGHVLRGAAVSERAAYSAMVAYFRRRAAQGEDPRARTRRGRVLTTVPRLLHLDMQLVGKARRAAMFGAEGLETGTDLAKLKLVATNREKWKRNVECLRGEAMRKWTRENVKASDKRRVAKERYEARARLRVAEEQKE